MTRRTEERIVKRRKEMKMTQSNEECWHNNADDVLFRESANEADVRSYEQSGYEMYSESK